jgi:hypothetical protein
MQNVHINHQKTRDSHLMKHEDNLTDERSKSKKSSKNFVMTTNIRYLTKDGLFIHQPILGNNRQSLVIKTESYVKAC